MVVSFRHPEEESIEEVIGLMSEFYKFFNYPFDETLTRENLVLLINNKHLGRISTIWADNSLIGYLVLGFGFSFEYKGVDAFVDELFLIEEYRNRGIGGKVMDYIQELATASGIKVIHLEVEKDNTVGERLYLQKGFLDKNRKLLTKYL
jgi:ribosomal protein S18 acetylase RimI-like enzyme